MNKKNGIFMFKLTVNLLFFMLSLASFALTDTATILLDQTPLPDVSPTTYYVADEEKTPCKGRYGRNTYNGDEVSDVINPNGEIIAEVCTRFFKVLSMEGTGRLRDRGQGKVTVNWAGNYTFRKMDKCVFGEGVEKDLCLIPYHTIAADLNAHRLNSVVFIPKAKGLMLPDGRIHNGFFLVRDTGGAFRDVGFNRIDLFVGNETDQNNVFSRAGMHHRSRFKAYKLQGEMKDHALAFFKENFPTLFFK